MAIKRNASKSTNFGRRGEIGYTEIDNKMREKIAESRRLHELGVKFESDKIKLENEIEKVQASYISNEDKALIIEHLDAAIERLQEQYEKDVFAEQVRILEEMKQQIEQQIDMNIDELNSQVDSLSRVTMEVASVDASAGADAAEAKKQMFEQMKNEYVEKLCLQMEQAERQRKDIQTMHSSGR